MLVSTLKLRDVLAQLCHLAAKHVGAFWVVAPHLHLAGV